jgi:hypothetical protein
MKNEKLLWALEIKKSCCFKGKTVTIKAALQNHVIRFALDGSLTAKLKKL